MSSLAEINQQLMEQNKEQERTSVAVEDVRKALIAQMKEERRGRLDEKEDRKEAKKVAQKPQGFMAGLAEGTGAAGLGRFAQSLLGALFGGLSGGAIAGLAGTVAGKLLKGTVLAGLISTFGEDAIKSLFDKLKEKGIDFGFSKEQEDEIASRATDGLFAYVISGIIFRNPLVRIAAAIGTAYRDKIFDVIEYVLGIKITDLGGKNGFAVSMPNFFGGNDFKLDETWINGLTTAVTAFTAWLGLKLLKMGKNLIFKGEDKIGKAVDKAMKAERARFDDFQKQLDAERAARIDAERRLDNQSESRTAAAQNRAFELAAEQEAISQRIAAENRAKTQATLRRLQNINAQPLDIAPKVSAAPSMPTFEEGSRVSYTKKDGSTVDATVTRNLPNQMTQLKFDRGGKIAVDTSRITPIKPKPIDTTKAVNEISKTINTEVPKITSAINNGFQKATRVAGAFTIEGVVQEAAQYGAGKTGGVTSRLLGGVAKTIGSTAGLAASFVMGGLFENEAGDGTRSGVIDAQGYALMEAMANGENFSVIKEKRQDLFNIVSNSDFADMATPTHKALAMLTDSELLNLSEMVYAQANPGRIKGSRLGQTQGFLSSARFGQGRALYGEELSALDAIAAERQAMGISPVIIQDQSVRQGGSQSTTINSMSIPIESHDASWYQRRAAMGLGL